MFSRVTKTATACWKPVRQYARMVERDESISNNNEDETPSGSRSGSASNAGADIFPGDEPLLWSRDLEKHFLGEFSFAVFQANDVIEDHSQVETGHDATFVGVYDGHGGPEAARFIAEHLFLNLMTHARDHRDISEEVIKRALSETEDGFLTLVSRTYQLKPVIAAIGSCCLIGVILRGTLYIANLGDSRAVVASFGRSNRIVAEQLSREHNACREDVRQELMSNHPDDSSILVMRQGVWRIKGIIQVSRSIGDAYLKRPGYDLDPSFRRFHTAEPIRRPVLTAEPSVHRRTLQPNDQFVIFASDGLWEHLSNQEAVDIVHKNPRNGIAKRLIMNALEKVARKMNMRYEDLRNVEKGERRKYHDDITVVVLFLNHELIKEDTTELSIRGFGVTACTSKFSIMREQDTV